MAKKSNVPKRIAGVKLPKSLRRGLKRVAKSQDGKTVLTEALVAAAGVLAMHEAKPGSATREALAKNAPIAKAKAKAKAKAGAVVDDARAWTASSTAFLAAARAFTQTLRDHSAGTVVDGEVATPPIAH